MGLDISKITNAELQMLAYENDSERAEDINILIGEEFTKFRKAALDWAKSKNTAEASEAVRQTLGLYMTQPAATTEAEVKPEEVAKKEKVESKPDKKAEKKEKKIKKEDQDAIKEDVKNLVKNALNGKDTQPVDLSTVVARLREDNSNAVYADAIKEVEELVAVIQGKYNSKNEVEALEKNIKDAYSLSKFQKDILGDLVKLAKEDQINKEADELKRLYEKHVRNTEGATNYEKTLNTMKEKMEKEWYLKDNSYYSDEAFKVFEAKLKKEIHTAAKKGMEARTPEGDKDIDKKAVIEGEKNKLAENDKFAKKVVKKMDTPARITANRVNRERRRKELESISNDELKNELSETTYQLLKRNFLKGDGPYDLTKVSDAIRTAIGADEEMDHYEDTKRSEAQGAIDNLKELLGRNDVTEAQMKELKEFCNIKDAPKSRKTEDIFGNAKDEAIAGAAIGAALGHAKITNIATAIVEGFAESTAKQVIKISPLVAIPGVAAAEVAVDALVKAIIGVKKPEETCFNYEEANGKTIEEYLNKLKDTADSEEQYNAIAILAKLYANKYGEGWNTEFVNDMKNAAGGNSALNCKEFNSAYNGLIEKLKKTEKKEDTHTYSQHDQAAVDPTFVDVPAIDGSKTGWAQIARQYNCLVERYQLAGAIRVLKLAQAINDGNYSQDRLDQLYNLSKKGRSHLKNIEGFDYDKYIDALEATYLPKLEYDKEGNVIPGTGVKVPDKLGECTRNAELSLQVVRNKDTEAKGNEIKHPTGHAADKLKTSDGQNAKYFVRLDGGAIQAFDDKKERDDVVTSFKQKYPNAKVEKWENE